MADRYVHQIDHVEDLDGLRLMVGVDYDTVTIGHGTQVLFRLPAETAEKFAALFVRACWECDKQARIRAEIEREDAIAASQEEAWDGI